MSSSPEIKSAMLSTCDDCGGSGRWFDMPVTKRQVTPYEISPAECTGCDGWGLIPTPEGRPFFDMAIAMRHSPKWR